MSIDPQRQDKAAYLGDGVYASFDGFHIWLAANHHENRVVALEPEVLAHLIEYAQRIGVLSPKRSAP
jgi:hypothetical protein